VGGGPGREPDHGDEEQACPSRPGASTTATVAGTTFDVPLAAFATMFHKAWITRPDRPGLSDVRSSLLPDEPAPAIFTAMQGDHAS
jgi:hypothetical protein